ALPVVIDQDFPWSDGFDTVSRSLISDVTHPSVAALSLLAASSSPPLLQATTEARRETARSDSAVRMMSYISTNRAELGLGWADLTPTLVASGKKASREEPACVVTRSG